MHIEEQYVYGHQIVIYTLNQINHALNKIISTFNQFIYTIQHIFHKL